MDNPEKLATLGIQRHRTKTTKTIALHRKLKSWAAAKMLDITIRKHTQKKIRH